MAGTLEVYWGEIEVVGKDSRRCSLNLSCRASSEEDARRIVEMIEESAKAAGLVLVRESADYTETTRL